MGITKKSANLHVEPLAGESARPSNTPREALEAMKDIIRNIRMFLDRWYMAKTRIAMIATVVSIDCSSRLK
jgi:hypothetical protein